MKHVSEEQLVAFRDGEDDPRVREHLASCEECQRTFDDSRFGLSLRRMSVLADDPHPSSQELTAFWDNALSRDAAERVQRHIRGCDRCLAAYRRMRGIGPARAYASPSRRLVQEVQKRFSSRPSAIDLGELWLSWVGGALELVREPEPRWSMVRSVVQGVAEDLSLAEVPHPSSARARRQRLTQPSKQVHFKAGNLRLELQVAMQGDEPKLRVRLRWADTDKPARDVPLHVESDLEKGGKARTDDRGRAELTFPDRPSHLHIQASTPIRLRLSAAPRDDEA